MRWSCLILSWLLAASVYAESRFDRPLGHDHGRRRAVQRRYRSVGISDPPLSVPSVVRRLHELAGKHAGQLRLRAIGQSGQWPLYRVDLPEQRGDVRRPLRVLVSAGVHGDEPTAVHAAMKLIEKTVRRPPRGLQITVLPMVNPSGLARQQRNNSNEQDVNRSFRPGYWTVESKAVARSLAGEKYDLFVDLHGVFSRNRFFLIRAADDGALSGRILRAMESRALVDRPSPNMPSSSTLLAGEYTLSALGSATTNNPGTFKAYIYQCGTPYCYTLEYSRHLAPERQLRGLFKLLQSALHNTRRHGGRNISALAPSEQHARDAHAKRELLARK